MIVDSIDQKVAYVQNLHNEDLNKDLKDDGLNHKKKAAAYGVLFAEFQSLISRTAKKNTKIVRDAAKDTSKQNKETQSSNDNIMVGGSQFNGSVGDAAPSSGDIKINYNDPLDIIQKIKQFLQSFFSHCSNGDAIPNIDAFFNFMGQLGQHWDKLSPDLQKAISKLFNTSASGSTTALLFLRVKLLEIFFDAKRHGLSKVQIQQQIVTYLQNLQNKLTSTGAGKNPFISELLNSIKSFLSYKNGHQHDGVFNLVNAYDKGKTLPPDQSKDLLNAMMMRILSNMNEGQFFKDIRIAEIQLILAKTTGNPMLAILMLVAVVFNDYTNDQSFKVSTNGATSKKLKKIASDINNLTNVFIDGYDDKWQDPDDVKKFLTSLNQIRTEVNENSTYFPGQGKDGKACLQQIFNIGWDPTKNAPSTDTSMTLGTYLTEFNIGDPAKMKDAIAKAQALLKGTTLPNKGQLPKPGIPVPPGSDAPGAGYNTVTGQLKQLSNIFLDQSSFIVSNVQNTIALMNQGLGCMKSVFGSIEKLANAVVNNFRQQ